MSILVLLALGAVWFVVAFLNGNPLKTNGFSQYDNGNRIRQKVNIEIVNEGMAAIRIRGVIVNGKPPAEARLIISYSGQSAASAGIDTDPLAKFTELNGAPVHKALSPKEWQAAVRTQTTPVGYAIRIVNDERIDDVTIKYTYFGVPFKRKVSLRALSDRDTDVGLSSPAFAVAASELATLPKNESAVNRASASAANRAPFGSLVRMGI